MQTDIYLKKKHLICIFEYKILESSHTNQNVSNLPQIPGYYNVQDKSYVLLSLIGHPAQNPQRLQ